MSLSICPFLTLCFMMLCGSQIAENESITYERIKRVEYTTPPSIPVKARDLIALLLVADPVREIFMSISN